MDFLNGLIKEKYILYNVDENKKPIVGTGDNGWSKITYEKALTYHKKQSKQWAIRTGIQPNGEFIIVLDWDMWYKVGGEYIESENTRKLFKQFFKINSNQEGVFSSSTELNRGVIVNITKSKKLLDIISLNGSSKIQKKDYHLEVLTNFTAILPPAKTKCKVRQTVSDERKFLNEEKKILFIEPNSELETFIYNYIESATNKPKLKNSMMRTKTQKENYYSYIEKDEKEQYCSSSECIKIFLKHLDIDRVLNYNEWYKVGYAIKNSYGQEGINAFKVFSARDMEGYNEQELTEYYNSWNSKKYEALNSNYIIDCLKNDNPEKFIYCLAKYEEQKGEEQFKKTIQEFEKNVRKILEPPVYIKKHRKTKEWEYCEWNDITHAYKEIKGYGVEFLKAYEMSSGKNYYDFLDFIPNPNFKEEDQDKLKTFNLFNGFYSSKLKLPSIIKNTEHIENGFKNHLMQLCNNDLETYQFLFQWIAHLVHNTDKRPGISIVLQGLEGSGKSTLYELLNKLLGDKYVYSTPRPEKTVFERFNDVLTNKILVNINEPDFNSFKGHFEEFKGLITDKTFSVESKNKPKITLSNHMWFLLTTNNEKLFTLSSTDRRFYFIKTSNDLIGKKDYFNNLYGLMNNDDYLATIFNYLKENINLDYNFEYNQKNNKTEFHKLLVENSQNPLFSFLQEFVENQEQHNQYLDNNEIIITPKDILKLYHKYCKDNSINNYENGMALKMKMKSINSNIHKKINNKSSYVFTPDLIIDYLKVNKCYLE